MDDGCQHSAAALTYMTLFAVVPMMTVTYSMFALVPIFQGVGEQLQQLIFENFVPAAGAEVESYLQRFSQQARGLSIIGVLILLVTTYLMLVNIERVFNRIWSTPGRRRGVLAFLIYWAILSLGPLLIGTAILMNTYLFSVQLFTADLARNALNMVFEYLPLLFTLTAFTLLYYLVPNCRVLFRSAVIGGLVSTLAFELAKSGFSAFVASSSFSSIYGAFATIPIFLLWIYLCWTIILVGAEVVRATESIGAEISGDQPLHASAVIVLWLFWKAHHRGQELKDQDLYRAGISADRWRYLRDCFVREGLLAVSDRGHYLLLKSLDEISLWDLLQFFPRSLEESEQTPLLFADAESAGWWQVYQSKVTGLQLQGREQLHIGVSELFRTERQPESVVGPSTNTNMT